MEKNVFAFESWSNGSMQFSTLHKGEEALRFIEEHETSNTFADLWVFDTQEKAEAKMIELYAENPQILKDWSGISEEMHWEGASPREYYICPVTGNEVTISEASA